MPGRFYQNVLTLAPGVRTPTATGTPTCWGRASADFKAQVSGVSNQDPLTGGFASLVNPDSIEEIEVVTAGRRRGVRRRPGRLRQHRPEAGEQRLRGRGQPAVPLEPPGRERRRRHRSPATSCSPSSSTSRRSSSPGPSSGTSCGTGSRHEYHYIDQPDQHAWATMALHDHAAPAQRRPHHLAGLPPEQAAVPVPLRSPGVQQHRRQLHATGPESAEERTADRPTYVVHLGRALLHRAAREEPRLLPGQRVRRSSPPRTGRQRLRQRRGGDRHLAGAGLLLRTSPPV